MLFRGTVEIFQSVLLTSRWTFQKLYQRHICHADRRDMHSEFVTRSLNKTQKTADLVKT
jgi:hypothetical protein